MNKPLILIDANNVCHIALHTMGELSHLEMKTGVIFGFFVRLLKLWEEFGSNRFIFCWDSRKRFRASIYPEYKKNRSGPKSLLTPEQREVISNQMEALRCEILPALGFQNQLHQTGYEADDMIAAATLNLKMEGDKIIVSTDKDLYQLLGFPECKFIYNPVTKKKLTGKWFEEEKGIKPAEWVIAKAAMGDSGDNIPGIPGIGEKSALAWIKGTLTGKKYDDLNGDKYKLEFKRNWRLVSLPFEYDGFPIKIPPLQQDDLSEDRFIDIFDYHGFQSFLKPERLSKWREFISG